jgi:hypothetical protein
MGGVVDALSSVAKDAGEQIAKDFPKESIQNLWTKLRPMQNEAAKSEAGQYWLKTVKENYIPNYHRALQAGVDGASKLPKEMQPHPAELVSQARNVARVSTFGQNDALGAGIIKAASQSKGMTESQAHIHAQNLADFTAMILHDTETRPTWRGLTEEEKAAQNTANLGKIKAEESIDKSKSTRAGQTAPFSTFKQNVTQNKENPTWLKLDAVYHPQSPLETSLQRYAQRTIAPLIVLPHLQNVMNLAISTPLKDLIPAIAETIKLGNGNEYEKATEFARRAGVFSGTSLDAYTYQWLGSRGISAKVGGDNFGVLVNKLIHNPGLDPVRKWQLSLGAAAGKHTVEDFAQKLVDSGGKDKRAIYELQKMGLNINDIMRQKGTLNPDQYEKAIFHYVDSKVFLDSTLQRSFYARANPFTRLAFMYHSFITRQGQLLKEELMKPIRTGDWSSIPQTMAVLGVAFPLVGMLTKDLTMLGRGDWNDVHMKKDVDDWMGQNGPKALFYQALDDYSHTAGFGILSSYIRGGTRYATANTMIGPIGNVGARLIDDGLILGKGALDATLDRDSEKSVNYKPLLRDFLEYNPASVDNLGKLVAHQYVPTKKEEAERNPKPSMRFKSKSNKHFHFKKGE